MKIEIAAMYPPMNTGKRAQLQHLQLTKDFGFNLEETHFKPCWGQEWGGGFTLAHMCLTTFLGRMRTRNMKVIRYQCSNLSFGLLFSLPSLPLAFRVSLLAAPCTCINVDTGCSSLWGSGYGECVIMRFRET